MRKISLDQLGTILAGLPQNPRVIASGNFATPHALLNGFDSHVASYTLHMLNAQIGIPRRDGVRYESAFVGPGMRNSPALSYVPSRLSLLPVLIRDHLIPDVVLLHTSTPRFDTVSLGTEVNILPAAIEAVREHGGIVIAQANPQMPYTYGDSQIYESEIDLFDQANASRVRGQIYSGFGGSTDFIVGSLHSRGGRSFMALPSWHAKSNTSSIVPLITEAVTSFQHSYVVTEQGAAACFGRSQAEQASNLIEHAAHPDARELLWKAASDLGLR